jgi:uncharacterized protein YdhG (YjbR/CyaY superfamily)
MTDKKSAKINEDNEAVLAAIAAMRDGDRQIAEKLHDIIMTSAPSLQPRTWYNMPAYSNGNKIVCWFRSGEKFGERYMTLGFNDVAQLDEGSMWPINYAIQTLSSDDEVMIADLLKKAVTQ